MLGYNENLDAYEMNITENQLRGAPAIARGWDTGRTVTPIIKKVGGLAAGTWWGAAPGYQREEMTTGVGDCRSCGV